MYKNQYKSFQGSRLSNCEQNRNFPLNLNKKLDLALSSDDIVYQYSLLRLNSDVLTSKFVTDTYSFRLNETSRFFFNLGMHFLTSHLILQVTDIRSLGQEFFGKQIFNQNQIDLILPPGDYAVTISQPSIYERFPFSDIAECGLYSFSGHITPMSTLMAFSGQGDNSMKQFSSAKSKCMIKEVAPFKIYSSLAETKQGGEYYVNAEGVFYRYFEDLLFKKSANTYLNPEFERIQISSKEDALLSVLL